MKISLKRLLVESFKLQDRRQQSSMIRNVAVESVGSCYCIVLRVMVNLVPNAVLLMVLLHILSAVTASIATVAFMSFVSRQAYTGLNCCQSV